MSTHVIGIKPPDETWQKMKAVWDASVAAGIPVPDAVSTYFDGETPDPAGVTVDLQTRPWRDDMREGFEVDIDDLPAHVRTIRFYNSW